VVKKQTTLPHIPLKFEEAVDEFLKVKPPKRRKKASKKKESKQGDRKPA
jgi:hypothetical protein